MNKKRQIYVADHYRESEKIYKLVDMGPKKSASVTSLHKSNVFTFALNPDENSMLKTQAVEIKMFL